VEDTIGGAAWRSSLLAAPREKLIVFKGTN